MNSPLLILLILAVDTLIVYALGLVEKAIQTAVKRGAVSKFAGGVVLNLSAMFVTLASVVLINGVLLAKFGR